MTNTVTVPEDVKLDTPFLDGLDSDAKTRLIIALSDELDEARRDLLEAINAAQPGEVV